MLRAGPSLIRLRWDRSRWGRAMNGAGGSGSGAAVRPFPGSGEPSVAQAGCAARPRVSSSSRFYCEIGRPSVDPELMIRTLLIGYCYSIRSKRRLCDEVRLGLAYRWFCGLGLDAAVPHHVARRTMASLIGSACVWSMAGLRTVATILAVASTGGARQSVYSLWSWNAIGAQAPFSLEGAQCATRWAIHDA